MKVMIDTNVFLLLYTSKNEKIEIFDDLQKIASYLFIPEQIIDEFYRNRDSNLTAIYSSIKNINFNVTASSSFFCSFPEFSQLKTKSDECIEIKKQILKRIKDIKDNPKIDPILQRFNKLMENQNILLAKVTDEVINKAHHRYLRGNPPKSVKSEAIADEIIWELILSNISDDLIIVTGDGTYFDNITFLKREFSFKTGKELTITEKLGDAIKIIGQTPSKAIEEFDKENKNRISLRIPDGWEIVSINDDIATVKRGGMWGETPVRNHSPDYICFNCGNYGPWNGIRCCSCGSREI